MTAGRAAGEYVFVGVFLAFVSAGCLIVYRVPANLVGWLLTAEALAFAVGVSADALTSAERDAIWADLVGWLGDLFWAPMIALLIALLAVFPTGRALTRRWRVDVWSAVGFVVLALAANGFGPLMDEGLPNPFAVPAIAQLAEPAGALAGFLLLVGVVFGIASLVDRFRRAGASERQQIKWFVFAAFLLPPALVISDATQQSGLGPWVLGLAMLALPISIAIAILRYRLYEIDRIINRTVVYGVVVGLLAALFAGGVFLLRGVLPGQQSDLAVAASTLGVAALFNPLRHRIQGLVDRRFYRSRYDAQRVVEAFSARLRDEVDLESLTSELAEVVQDSVQPEIMSVWVK